MFEFKKTAIQQKQRFALRAWVGGLFALVCFGVLVGRFWYLQVDRYEGLSERADRNRIAVVPIPPRRGEILDRNGVVMARNYRTYTLEVVPGQVGDIDAMLERLTPVVYISPGDQRRFKRRVKESGRYAKIILRNNLNDTEASWFAAHAFEFPGVELRARWVREYPQGATAGHVVGYIGRISESDVEALEEAGELGNYRGTDVIGKKGIEKSWETALHGKTGFEEVEVNASGRPIRTLKRIDPEPGVDVMLSIDLGLQRVAEEAFGKHRGALVAIDPNTGEVLAFVSKPAFDPNLFIDGIDVENWRLLNESPDHPLINRPLYGTYPIGSTYKPFVALAALELGVRDAKTRFSDPGYYEFGNQRFRNAGGAAYGMTDMHKAIVVSSDTYFYSLGPEIGVNRLHDFAKQFGFGQITGIDLDGERMGVLPSTDWKRRAYKDRKQQQWYAGETISVAVGQGYNSFTLLQLAQATSTLANYGAYRKPHLVHATRNADTGETTPTPSTPEYRIPLKRENVDIVKNAMVGVVRSGTARRAFANTPYQAAGKTGTAQVFSLRGGKYRAAEIDERLRDHALFMGFAPVENPSIAVALLVENAGWGASVAAPIARTVFDYWLLRHNEQTPGTSVLAPSGVSPLNVPPTQPASEPEDEEMMVPERVPGATRPEDPVEPPPGVVLGELSDEESLPPLVPGSDTPPPNLRPRPAPKPAPAPQAPTVTRRPYTAPALSDLTDLFESSGSRVKP
ncbi:penicillin-binding protein 2 [Bordetella sp. 15P40C-2]|uniref:penicillin-binding protein 2 n=1 Tax=Bordetella sp. 15P40C-2 TaxID=2572246 RepID=UPI00132760BD|nr:penicillin-binding protein 2 [Bordetella sp. 15P40C-2]MVW70442.1 penicillin-binding protein 2 [Bordetella sp. 15P40C-2]